MPTIAGLLPYSLDRYGDAAALSIVTAGRRQDVSYTELADHVAEIGLGLIELGLRPGDHVAILSDTRPEWTYTQLAVTTAGAVVVPIYPSSSAGECQWVLENPESTIVVCENAAQREKITAVLPDLPRLRHLIVVESLEDGSDVLTLPTVRRTGDPRALWTMAEAVRPEDPCAIVYTSGTTGRPKGCVLSHRNFRATLDALQEHEPIRRGESTSLFLPLAHVFSLVLQLLCLDVGGRLAFWGGDPSRIFEEIQEVRPAYFPAIPRIFEKVYGRFAPKLRAELGDEGFNELVAIGRRAREAQNTGRELCEELRTE